MNYSSDESPLFCDELLYKFSFFPYYSSNFKVLNLFFHQYISIFTLIIFNLLLFLECHPKDLSDHYYFLISFNYLICNLIDIHFDEH